MIEVDERIIISEFLHSMRQTGLSPRDEAFTPILDGQLHRFALEGDRYGETSGAYFIHADNWPNWGFQDWHEGNVWHKFKLSEDAVKESTGYHKPTHEEYLKQRAENEAKKRKDNELQQEKQKALISKAYSLWRSDSINHDIEAVNQHAYMQFKQVSLPHYCYAGINKEGWLLFPLFHSLTNEFRDIQFISPPDSEGHSQKRFFAGISNKGCWYRIRQFKGDTLFLCEGIATALSIDEFTRGQYSVAAAMSCSNLVEVARNCRTLYPNQKIIIAADHDRNHAGENAARKVCEAGYADDFKMPPEFGDWNDFYLSKKGQQNNEQ
jgi:phage/plasmid primase-like uncharacterized protein